MSEVAKAVKPLFDKFIDFFDIFDLSFFVSGATFVAAVAWARLTPDLELLLGYRRTEVVEETLVHELPGVGIIVLIFASYISGMTCFAMGRFVRKWVWRAVDGYRRRRGKLPVSVLYAELAQHGVIAPDPSAENRWRVTEHGEKLGWLSRYFIDGGAGQESALYVRMWAEVRQRELFAPSFSLLRRYWVSSATLDGLFIALTTWAILLSFIEQAEHGWLPTLATLAGALFCLREARRYSNYQREELVATLILAYDLPAIEAPALGVVPPTAAPSAAVSFAADGPASFPAAVAEARTPITTSAGTSAPGPESAPPS